LRRGADALFELIDAILAADVFPSELPEAVHHRGCGNLYAAVRGGRKNDEEDAEKVQVLA
jgi:hypothetical protein